ncbi:MAG: AAA family ATPase, partial [Rectinema sp.]|nr:AAA family ATPase [Rectinema sp.]
MSSPRTDPPYLEVVFPIPVDESFTYLNPGIAPLEPGMRVEAPLGSRSNLAGYIIHLLDEIPACIDPARLRSITRRVDDQPLFGADTLDLARWLSRMYHCSLGEALSAMLPSARRERGELSDEFEEIELGREARTLTPGQAAALEGILSQPGGMSYLYGPTGTGKTEVFLQLAEATLAQGRTVLYLVPEIALTP